MEAQPVQKRRKLELEKTSATLTMDDPETDMQKQVIIKFQDPEGQELSNQFDLPADATRKDLNTLLNSLLGNDEPFPYKFFLDDHEIATKISDTLEKSQYTSEHVLPLRYFQQAVFRVSPVTRNSSTLAGHSEAILSVTFSPDGESLATGSGDKSMRLWDMNTATPLATCSGHTGWVLCVEWAPDCSRVATGSKDGTVRLWANPSGEALGRPLSGHTKFITSLSWEPMHKDAECRRLLSSSKDCTVRMWDTLSYLCILAISSHTSSITRVLWGGEDLIFTASQDTTVKVWDTAGRMIRSLKGHGHWVNTMTISTDAILRTGCYDHTRKTFETNEERQQYALERYQKVIGKDHERLVTGSDDFTLYLWNPYTSKKPVQRMTGHQNLINSVAFSPDGHFLISGSFDKSIKLWDGHTGQFLSSFRGHVGAIYKVCWSPDSRLFISASKDSTVKVWNLKSRKMMYDLPGHADEVYAADWCPLGTKGASGGKDRLLKLWSN